MRASTHKLCDKCKGTGKVKLKTKDIERMTKIMKRHGLTQVKVAQVVGVNQATVSGWLKIEKNPTRNIKDIYFERLKRKGFT